MNKVAFVASIMVLAGCFLPWLPTQKIGIENKEWIIVLSLSVVSTVTAMAGIKRPGKTQWLYTFIALGISAVLALEVKMIINAEHVFSLSAAGKGLLVVAGGTLLLLITGIYNFPKVSIAAIIIATGIAVFTFNKINAANPDQAKAKPDVTIDAATFINSFEKDSASANKQFIDKTVLVTGKIKSIDTSGVISLGEAGQMSSIQCSMDKRHKIDYGNLKEGMPVAIKGKCVGYDAQELLGTDVQMNFCVLDNKK